MAKVKVWNDNTVTWNEKFKGDDVKIPAKGYVEMEFYEAHEFKGQFSPIKVKADGTQDPGSFKMIRVEPLEETAAGEIEDGQEIFPCNLCRKVFTTEAALLKHSDAAHADRMVNDPEAEKHAPKRGPGRPPKAAEANA
jgi:uncharacterized C2H2 Zn-finger protein